MAAHELDVRWNLVSVAGEGKSRDSSFQMTAPSREEAPRLMANLLVQVSPERSVACLPENAFVPLAQVASRVEIHKVEHHLDGFVVPGGSTDGLQMLLQELQCESVLMTFGGQEAIEKLKEVARPAPWWRLARPEATRRGRAGFDALMCFSPSHGSLEVVGERTAILGLFDLARKILGAI